MDQTYINMVFEIVMGVLALFSAIAGWVLKSIHSSLKDLQKSDDKLADKVSAIEILVAGDYVKRQYFDERAKEIFDLLNKIRDMLDKKIDK